MSSLIRSEAITINLSSCILIGTSIAELSAPVAVLLILSCHCLLDSGGDRDWGVQASRALPKSEGSNPRLSEVRTVALNEVHWDLNRNQPDHIGLASEGTAVQCDIECTFLPELCGGLCLTTECQLPAGGGGPIEVLPLEPLRL